MLDYMHGDRTRPTFADLEREVFRHAINGIERFDPNEIDMACRTAYNELLRDGRLDDVVGYTSLGTNSQ